MLNSTLMKAVQLVRLGKPLENAEVSFRDIGASEVLVRVEACGICHSDAHYRAGISPMESLPVTLGHEVAGRVDTVGRDVHHVSSGDRVYVHYLVLSLIHISEPTRLLSISYAVFCLKKKK